MPREDAAEFAPLLYSSLNSCFASVSTAAISDTKPTRVYPERRPHRSIQGIWGG